MLYNLLCLFLFVFRCENSIDNSRNFCHNELKGRAVKMSDPAETAPLLKSVETTSEWSADRIRASKRWITIEPVIFTALIAYGTIGTLRTEYIRMLVAESFGVNGTGLQPNCSVNRSDPQYKLQEEIQSQTSLSVMYLQLCSAFLNIFSAPVLSSWSDRSGRKGVLFLAALGIFVNCIMYLVVTTFSLSQYLLFIGETVQGLTGSLILIVAASLAYIADITTKKKRLFRFVIIDTTLFFAIGLSQVLMGYIVRDYGYMPPFAAVSAALAVALLYIVLPPCLIETRRCSEEESSGKWMLEELRRIDMEIRSRGRGAVGSGQLPSQMCKKY